MKHVAAVRIMKLETTKGIMMTSAASVLLSGASSAPTGRTHKNVFEQTLTN